MMTKKQVCALLVLAVFGANANEKANRVCSMQLQGQMEAVTVSEGFTAAICPPTGKKIKHIYGQARHFGWVVTLPEEPDDRLLLAPGNGARTVNLLITFGDESQAELLVKASAQSQ